VGTLRIWFLNCTNCIFYPLTINLPIRENIIYFPHGPPLAVQCDFRFYYPCGECINLQYLHFLKEKISACKPVKKNSCGLRYNNSYKPTLTENGREKRVLKK